MSSESPTAASGSTPRPPAVASRHSLTDTSRQSVGSETCIGSDLGEDIEEIEAVIQAIQASDIPVSYAVNTKKKRRKVFSVKLSQAHAQKANDPFDYKHKFTEDAPFQEMGEMARVWKMFLEEYMKYDTEMVEDWRDGLDVLLVFVRQIPSFRSFQLMKLTPSGRALLRCRDHLRRANLPEPPG
ncbi:hypothetical protein BDZ89DRAFT_545723 [Hymenopellis radicata]|nr:hypothetical protein BDZ89DRAFT_545723 [Hymenopellis radicata]